MTGRARKVHHFTDLNDSEQTTLSYRLVRAHLNHKKDEGLIPVSRCVAHATLTSDIARWLPGLLP
jgi:hypothetical protein